MEPTTAAGGTTIPTMTPEALHARLKTLLPEDYQECYEDLQPVSMGSAALKYSKDGKVAWDEIWGSFCDLAMAGGPPHRGTLLKPGTPADIAAHPDAYAAIAAELCRGISMVAYLPARPSPSRAGWIEVDCETPAKAGWLARAIVMENVAARYEGAALLLLPAGPHYRIEKEVKNVITSIAKTCHYWDDHMLIAQQSAIRELFERMNAESPFVQAPLAGGDTKTADELGATIQAATGLRPVPHQYSGWLGLECPNVAAAVWMMRALVAFNVAARREETTLFVPVDPESRASVVHAVSIVHRYA